jgi:aerobic C4-dicarboxylate transport protein
MAVNSLADGFFKLIKVLTPHPRFTRLLAGIGSVGGLKQVGRVGIEAEIYFEVVTSLARVFKGFDVSWVRPGFGRRYRRGDRLTKNDG